MRFQLALSFTFLALLPGPTSGQSKPPFRLTLTANPTVYKAGSEVRVQITQTNTSDETMTTAKSIAPDQAEFHYTMDVRDSKGRPAPQTEYGRDFNSKGDDPKHTTVRVGNEGPILLKPGESMEDEAIITKFFDLSHPGKYTIQVSRLISRETDKGIVRSNTISITIKK
jgi:hypothetical protein